MQDVSINARRLGVASGVTVAALSLVYAVVLAVGLLTLPSADRPIQSPWFTIMELLIIAISPAAVVLAVAVHACVPAERKPLALASLAFTVMMAALTCAVHFSILTLSRQPAFADERWGSLVFSFQWPSVAYALDILAWDVFFPLAALFAALGLGGQKQTRLVRWLLFASAGLAFAGLAGVPLADMRIRNIGIVGYAALYPIAAGVLARLLHRAGRNTMHDARG